MNDSPPIKIKTFILAFFLVLVLVVIVITSSIQSVNKLSTKTEHLVSSNIPELKEMADLQNIMYNIIINHQQYYATLDRNHHETNTALVSKFKNKYSSINYLKNETDLTKKLKNFNSSINAFDEEMSLGRERDWDKLREHLYESQNYAEEITAILSSLSNQIRKNVSKTSVSTMNEVTSLNRLQLGFNITILIISLFVIVNIYGRIKDQKELYRRAYYNDNTGLPNRRSLEKNLEKKISSDPNHTYTLLNLKLDRFKFVTGSFGHEIGDRFLKASSEWMCNTLKKQHTDYEIYQFTNTSWLILLNTGSNHSVATKVAEELLKISSTPMNLGEIEITTSCSIGISFKTRANITITELLRDADTALRIAMQTGGNHFKFYSEEMCAETQHWINTDNALRYAIQKNEFQLFYQPKIDFLTNKIASSEALIRWQYNGEYISPGIFIPIAENSGLILKIGKWVLYEACRQWVSWHKQGLYNMPIAVNVSALQFQEPDFTKLVQSILTETGMPAAMLELEITEEAAINDPGRVVSIIQELKRIGVSLAIDDFGTGYSSLSQLSKLPVDVLKIDQSFVKRMDSSETDLSIVKLILDLARELKFKTVVEGIETEEQHETLRKWGCHMGQGFLFSRPVPADEFIALAEQQKEYPKLVVAN